MTTTVWYKPNQWNGTIDEVVVVKRTPKTITIQPADGTAPYIRVIAHSMFYETWDAAFKIMLTRKEDAIKNTTSNLERFHRELADLHTLYSQRFNTVNK